MADPIVIKKIDHKPPIMKDIFDKLLAGCYFYPAGDGTYIFVSKFEVPLASGIESGKDFNFNLGPFAWSISKFSISPKEAHGSWVANAPRRLPIHPPGDHDDDGEGSFQGQAGGHGQVPEQSAAAGSSY